MAIKSACAVAANAHGELPWSVAIAPWLETKLDVKPGRLPEEVFAGPYHCPSDDRDDRLRLYPGRTPRLDDAPL